MTDAASQPEFDPLHEKLEQALQDAIGGAEPDLDALAGGDPELKERLRAALEQALRLLPESKQEAVGLRRLGQYVIEGELGRGGMGTVMLGRHESLDRRVALKVLPRPYSLIAENRERFRREGRAMARVKHPHVLPIHEVGEEDGVPFAALELAAGGTIEDALSRMRARDFVSARALGERELPGEGGWEQRVAGVLATVGEALAAVHASGVVHRDIKPSNILFDEGTVFLGDFGLALQSDMATLTSSGAIVGTRHYLAPELTEPDGKATPESDIYALGVTLYEMLTLEAPFQSDSEEDLFRVIRGKNSPEPRRLNRHVSPELSAICLQALEKTPEHRFASAADMAADLRAVAEGAPIKFARVPHARRLFRRIWYRRSYVPLAALIMIAIGALVFAVVSARDASRIQEAQRLVEEEAEFVQTFRKGEALLVLNDPMDPNPRKQTEAALGMFAKCERLRPKRREVLLRLANAHFKLRQRGKAEEYVRRAVAEAPDGAPLKLLLKMIVPAPGRSPLARVSPTVVNSWPDVDRLLYAEELFHQNAHREAFEIAYFVGDELLSPELLTALCCYQSLFNPTRENRIFVSNEAHFRMALQSFDRSLQLAPTRVVEDNRAFLIRDAIFRDLYSGTDSEELLAFVIDLLQRRFEADRTLYSWSHYVKALFVAVTKTPGISDALERGVAASKLCPPDKLKAIHPNEYVPIPSLAILAGDYEYALKLGRIRDLGEYVGFPGLFQAIVAVRWHWSGKCACRPDVEGLREFLGSHASQISAEERASCEKLLLEMTTRDAERLAILSVFTRFLFR